jgi:hypothetical protein
MKKYTTRKTRERDKEGKQKGRKTERKEDKMGTERNKVEIFQFNMFPA